MEDDSDEDEDSDDSGRPQRAAALQAQKKMGDESEGEADPDSTYEEIGATVGVDDNNDDADAHDEVVIEAPVEVVVRLCGISMRKAHELLDLTDNDVQSAVNLHHEQVRALPPFSPL